MNKVRFVAAMLVIVIGATSNSQAQNLKPFSSEDRCKVEELLKSFDPNSYDFRYRYVDPSGRTQSTQVGRARGLANLRQRDTVRGVGGPVASTNININIFRRASTNININIFKEAASTNININIFKDAHLQARARELNAILQKYYVETPR